MNKKRIYTLFVLLILTLLVSACATPMIAAPVTEIEEPVAVEPIRVGSTVPLTGFLSPTGGKIHPLIGDLFLERLNESGGLLGRPVEWIVLDDESSPAKATALYEQLITEEKVDLIIGSHGSDSNLAAMKVAEQYGMVFPHHTSGLSYAYTYERHFSLTPTGLHPNITQAETLFEALEASGAPPKTVAFVISQFSLDQFLAHGYEGAGGAVDVAEARGYEVVLEVEYPAGTTDFSAIAAQVEAADADFLYMLGVGLDGLNLIKAMQALDYHPPAIYPALSPLGPLIGTGENVLNILAFAPSEPYLSYPDAAWLIEAYPPAAAEAGLRSTALDATAAQSWATWQLLVAGVEGAGSLDHAAIADWLLHNEVETIQGPMTFDPENQNYGPDLYAIAQIQDKKWVMVYPPELATEDYTVQYAPSE